MPGLYAPYKTYSSGEILTAADLNATDVNHITNQTLEMTDDYSADAATYHLTTTPSHATLPTSAAEEIRHIRGAVKRNFALSNWDDVPKITSVGTDGEYATIKLAIAASKKKLLLCSDISVTEEQDFSLSNGCIISNGFKIIGSSAIAGAILKVSGNDIDLDVNIEGTHTSGTTTKGLEITGARAKGKARIFQNGAGGTITTGVVTSGNYNQLDFTIDDLVGTITTAVTDSGTLNDLRYIDLVS